jgi:uncharacterized protein YjdB
LKSVIIDGHSLEWYLDYVTGKKGEDWEQRNIAVRVMFGNVAGGSANDLFVRLDFKNIDLTFDNTADHTLKLAAGFTSLNGNYTEADQEYKFYYEISGGKWREKNDIPALIATGVSIAENGQNNVYTIDTLFAIDNAAADDALKDYINVNGAALTNAVTVSVVSGKLTLTAAKTFNIDEIVLLPGLEASNGAKTVENQYLVYGQYDGIWAKGGEGLKFSGGFNRLQFTGAALEKGTRTVITLTFDKALTDTIVGVLAAKGTDASAWNTADLVNYLNYLILNGCRDSMLDGISVNGRTLREYLDGGADLIIAAGNAESMNVLVLSFGASVLDVGKNIVVTVGEAFFTMMQGKTAAEASFTYKAYYGTWASGIITAVTQITVSESAKEVTAGDTYTVGASVSPDGASDKTLTYKSSDETVATVDSNGVVTALNAGTAVITVAGADGAEVQVTITVRASAPSGGEPKPDGCKSGGCKSASAAVFAPLLALAAYALIKRKLP